MTDQQHFAPDNNNGRTPKVRSWGIGSLKLPVPFRPNSAARAIQPETNRLNLLSVIRSLPASGWKLISNENGNENFLPEKGIVNHPIISAS